MFLSFLLLLWCHHVVSAILLQRRPPPHACQQLPMILAQGAPTQIRGKTFSDLPSITYQDPRIDETGVGTTIFESLAPCQQQNARSIKINGTKLALNRALRWLDNTYCVDKPCVVYTQYNLEGVHEFSVQM